MQSRHVGDVLHSSGEAVAGSDFRDRQFVGTREQELRDLDGRWLKVEDDPVALESILAPDFVHVVPAGIISKNEQLEFMRKHPATKKERQGGRCLATYSLTATESGRR